MKKNEILIIALIAAIIYLITKNKEAAKIEIIPEPKISGFDNNIGIF